MEGARSCEAERERPRNGISFLRRCCKADYVKAVGSLFWAMKLTRRDRIFKWGVGTSTEEREGCEG